MWQRPRRPDSRHRHLRRTAQVSMLGRCSLCPRKKLLRSAPHSIVTANSPRRSSCAGCSRRSRTMSTPGGVPGPSRDGSRCACRFADRRHDNRPERHRRRDTADAPTEPVNQAMRTESLAAASARASSGRSSRRTFADISAAALRRSSADQLAASVTNAATLCLAWRPRPSGW